MAKTSLLLVSLTLVACGGRTTTSPRDAGTSGDRLPTPDVAAADSPAGPDESGRGTETPPEAARSDLGALLPEVLGDNVARAEATEVLAREARPADQAGPTDAPAIEAAAETRTVDAAGADSPGDVPPEAVHEVQPVLVDSSLASFCSGDLPHMIVNGIESHPAMRAAQLCFECCAGGDLTAVTATFLYLVQFAWQGLNLGADGTTVLDLEKPPKQWQFWLVAGCDPTITSFECGAKTTTCNDAGQVYQSGFRGTLELARTSDYKADASLCLHFEPPADASSPRIRSLDLYAPHVVWSN